MTQPARALRPLLRECFQHEGKHPSPALRAATREFLRSASDDSALVVEAVAHLTRLPPKGAAWLALTFGTRVEEGGNVELSVGGLLQLFDAWCEQLAQDDEDTEDDTEDVLESFPSLCQALVAHLARSPARRDALAHNVGFLAQVRAAESSSYGATWVRQALEKTSGELIVLHAPSRRGLRVRYSNVSNCFHLFSLLQTAIGERLPGGQKPDPQVANVARDRAEGKIQDQAWWHYADAITNQADLGASLWGEMLVEAIPCVDRQRIILLWPKLLGSRSWDASFFHPHLAALPSDAIVTGDLTQAECTALVLRLRLSAAPPEPTS